MFHKNCSTTGKILHLWEILGCLFGEINMNRCGENYTLGILYKFSFNSLWNLSKARVGMLYLIHSVSLRFY